LFKHGFYFFLFLVRAGFLYCGAGQHEAHRSAVFGAVRWSESLWVFCFFIAGCR
jgi:hypothetical protein